MPSPITEKNTSAEFLSTTLEDEIVSFDTSDSESNDNDCSQYIKSY